MKFIPCQTVEQLHGIVYKYICRYFVKDLGDKKFKQHKLETIAKMEKYLASIGCRRKLVNEKRERERERERDVCVKHVRFPPRMLLSHFMRRVSSSVGGRTDCCDNCRLR